MKYAFTGGMILDGTKDMQPKAGLCILTDGEKITDIVSDRKVPAGYEKIDLGGKYIMPGLINMHVHLAGSGKPQKKQRDNEKLVKKIMGSALTRAVAYRMVYGFAKDELMSGVTTIRTVGGLGSFDTRLRDEIAAGKKTGPRILAANEGISVPGGHMAGSVSRSQHRGGAGSSARMQKGKRRYHQAHDNRRRSGRQGEGRARRAENAARDGARGLRRGSQHGI